MQYFPGLVQYFSGLVQYFPGTGGAQSFSLSCPSGATCQPSSVSLIVSLDSGHFKGFLGGKDEFVEKQVTKFGNISFHLFQAEPCKKFNGIFRNLTTVVHWLKEDAALVLEK